MLVAGRKTGFMRTHMVDLVLMDWTMPEFLTTDAVTVFCVFTSTVYGSPEDMPEGKNLFELSAAEFATTYVRGTRRPFARLGAVPEDR